MGQALCSPDLEDCAMATTFDPTTTAQQLATAYTSGIQAQITGESQSAQATSSALTKLQSVLSTFDTTLTGLSSSSSLSGSSSGLRRFSATVSSPDVGTASASSTAQPGTYQFYVQQLATSQQLVFQNLPAVPVALGGPLVVQLADGSVINVDLAAADANGDGTISQAEIARAINQADTNLGKVTASVVTAGGQSELLLSAGKSGADGAITLDTSGLPAGALKDALNAGQQLVPAQDAIVWLGGQGGVKLQQASNTFTAIDGVNVTFTRAMSTSEPPVTVTVAADEAGTASNVQKFVDAYNTLKAALDDLTKLGDTSSGTPSAALASDSGVIALRNRLNQIVRQGFGGVSLINLGVSGNRDGTLSFDKTLLDKKLAANPQVLDQVFGSAGLIHNTGMLGSLNQYLDSWLNVTSGQITTRQAGVQSQQKRLTARQTELTDQYNTMYQNYLKQFSQLQALQQQMSQTSGLFSTSASSG
jgi:flagellar hook-associated protein 2